MVTLSYFTFQIMRNHPIWRKWGGFRNWTEATCGNFFFIYLFSSFYWPTPWHRHLSITETRQFKWKVIHPFSYCSSSTLSFRTAASAWLVFTVVEAGRAAPHMQCDFYVVKEEWWIPDHSPFLYYWWKSAKQFLSLRRRERWTPLLNT